MQTLKEFAIANNLNESTARVWLKRGKIERAGETFQIAEKVKREVKRVTGKSVTPSPESETRTVTRTVTQSETLHSGDETQSETRCEKCNALLAANETLEFLVNHWRAQVISTQAENESLRAELDSLRGQPADVVTLPAQPLKSVVIGRSTQHAQGSILTGGMYADSI